MYKFSSADEVEHILEHSINNTNKRILVVAYQDIANDFLKEHQKVRAKVLSIDARGKIALSLKQVEPKPETPAKPARPKEASVVEKRPPRQAGPLSFEDKLSKFMKDSDDRLLDLRRNTESKRGGRGASRER